MYDDIWQVVAVLLPVKMVDGMTADLFPFDMKIFGMVATRIINEVKAVNGVVYDVTSKPPGSEGPGDSAGSRIGRAIHVHEPTIRI